MKLSVVVFTVITVTFLFAVCATAQQYVPINPVIPVANRNLATVRAADQPPVGMMTERTFIAKDGKSTTQVDSDAFKVNGVKVGFWGSDGKQLYPPKPAGIQRWKKGNCNDVLSVFFQCKEQAFEFIKMIDKETIAESWRTLLYSAPLYKDLSFPDAKHNYFSLK